MTGLVVFAAACGGDDDGGGGGGGDGANGGGDENAAAVEEATQAIEEAKAIPEFTLEAEPFDASEAEGMTILNIPVSSANPYVVDTDREMQAISEELGITFIEFENQGLPEEWARGMNQAISRNVDAIVLQAGVDPELLIPQLQRAEQADIPVVVTHLYQIGESPPESVADMIAAYVSVPFHEAAELEADWAVMQTDCEPNVLIVTSDEVPPSDGIVETMQQQLTDRCGDSAQAQVVNVPVTEWNTRISPEVQNAITSNPNLNYVLPIYDSMSQGAVAGIRAAGAGERVKIASYNGTPFVLELIQDGDIVEMDVGENINWLAYAAMDQTMRVLIDESLIIEDGNEETPLRIFDDSNIDETGTPPTPNMGYGDAYVAGYEQLWGLQ